MKKILALLVVLLLTISTFTACKETEDVTQKDNTNTAGEANQNEDNTETNTEPKEKIEIEFALWAGGGELEEFQAIADKVNAAAEDYQIKVVSIPADYYVKIQTMIAGKQAPDLIWLSQEHIPAYAELGALYDLTELNKNGQLPKENFYENIIRTAEYNDKLFGLPWIASPVITYLNANLFEEAGVDLPTNDWTWTEFIETAKKLTKDTDGDGEIDQYGYTINGWPPIQLFLWAEGGAVVDENYQPTINSEGSIKGLELLHDVLSSGIAPKRTVIDNNGFSEMFKASKVAMFMGGAADNFEKEVDFEVGHVAVPKGTAGQYTFDWTASTVMSAQTENPEVCYKALEDMTAEFMKWKTAPPLKGALPNILEFAPHKESALPVIEKSLEIARSGYYNKYTSEVNGKVWKKIYDQMLLDENYDFRAAADEVQEDIKAIMAE